LLNKHEVRYLLIGGRTKSAIREFGFDVPELWTDRILRILSGF